MTVRHPSLHAAVLVSGASALVYETTWARMLHRVFGVGDLAVATVLGAFFLGLGWGAVLGGRWATRLKRPALAYAALEAGIGLYAVLSVLLIPNLHGVYAAVGEGASFETLTLIRLLLALLVLLPPTLLLGATLPVLIRLVAARDHAWASPATSLYALNTLGAAAGAGLGGLWLIPTLGVSGSILVAAGGSGLAAAIVAAQHFSTVWRAAQRGQLPAVSHLEEAKHDTTSRRLRVALLLACVAGLSALAGEVLWTRVLRIVLQGTSAAFACMLVNYLLGIAIGSALAFRTEGHRAAMALFGAAQLALGLLTVGGILIANQLPRVVGLIHGEAFLDPHQPLIYLFVSALLLLPLSVAIGTSVPLAWRIAGGPAGSAPRHSGRVLAYNTLGGLVGSLAAGFVIVPLLGITRALLVVATLHFLSAGVAWSERGRGSRARWLGFAAVPILLGALAWPLGPALDLPYLLHAREEATRGIIEGPGAGWGEDLIFLREGRNTTVTVIEATDHYKLYNDGRPESGFGFDAPGYGAELALLGSFPTLFAKERERALVIGLGAGHTASIMLGGPWTQLDVVELEGAIVEAARVMHERRGKPFPLDDPRTRLIVDDARAQLVLSPPGTYDGILSQPSHPWLAGSSSLYTREFFLEVRRALRPGGVFSLWVNLFRIEISQLRDIAATLLSVFPYAQAYVAEDSSFLLCASDEPLTMGAEMARRVVAPGLAPLLSDLALDHIVDVASVRELDSPSMRSFAASGRVLDDDHPRLEFELSSLPHDSGLSLMNLDEEFKNYPWISNEAFSEIPVAYRLESVLARIVEVSARARALSRVERSISEVELTPQGKEHALGALAEARGDTEAALAHYDATGTSRGADDADHLRHENRMHHRLLEVAGVREAQPTSARSILSSSAAVGTHEAIDSALALSRVIDNPDDAAVEALLRTYREEGCPRLLGAPGLESEVAKDEHLALLAAGCSESILEQRRYGQEWSRVRRSVALEAYRLGQEAVGGDNLGAARFHFRRSLAANPSHGRSAAALARLLHESGSPEEARQVLKEALDSSRGLPQATSAIRSAAQELDFDL